MKIFPVVRISSPDHDIDMAAQQAEMAIELGADGVFLRDENSPTSHYYQETLLEAYAATRDLIPDSFVGINTTALKGPLGPLVFVSDSLNAGNMAIAPDALWTDETLTPLRIGRPKAELTGVGILRNSHPRLKKIQFIGGVACASTPRTPSELSTITRSAALADEYVDAFAIAGSTNDPTTAPALQTVMAIRDANPSKDLAITGGVTSETMMHYIDIATQVMVASAVETFPGSGRFDEGQLSRMILVAHEL